MKEPRRILAALALIGGMGLGGPVLGELLSQPTPAAASSLGSPLLPGAPPPTTVCILGPWVEPEIIYGTIAFVSGGMECGGEVSFVSGYIGLDYYSYGLNRWEQIGYNYSSWGGPGKYLVVPAGNDCVPYSPGFPPVKFAMTLSLSWTYVDNGKHDMSDSWMVNPGTTYTFGWAGNYYCAPSGAENGTSGIWTGGAASSLSDNPPTGSFIPSS